MSGMEETETAVRKAFSSVAGFGGEDEEENATLFKKCVELCRRHEMDAEKLTAQWEIIALNYPEMSSSALLRKLGDSLEREHRRKERQGQQGKTSLRTPTMTARTVKRMPGHAKRVDDFVTKFGVDLGEGTPERPSKRDASGFEGSTQKKRKTMMTPTTPPQSQRSTLETSTSPICTSEAYTNRTNHGKLELTFNKELELDWDKWHENQSEEAHVEVKLETELDQYQYMYTTLPARADELEEQLMVKKEQFKAIYNWDDSDFEPVGRIGQNEMLIYGRICNEAVKGKLNAKSLVLEGSRTCSNGARIKLDVDKLIAYSIFPGQIIVAKGTCPSGHTFYPTEIYTSLQAPKESSDQQEDKKDEMRPTSFIVAAGPFTTQEDLDYNPLEDLLAHVVESKPDVLILMGPLVDEDHPQVASGNCFKMNGETPMPCTYKEILMWVLQRIAMAGKTKTKVVVCPSTKDVTHHAAYPQPPIPCSVLDLVKNHEGIIMAPNPCIVKINGISIGINTADTIMHLAQDDVAKVDRTVPKVARIQRLAAHILHQKNFYPIFPPGKGSQLEITKWQSLTFTDPPDMLLMSSKLMHFAYDVEDTLFVNPGKLTRGKTGGMYARVMVGGKQVIPENISSSIPKRTMVEIVRI